MKYLNQLPWIRNPKIVYLTKITYTIHLLKKEIPASRPLIKRPPYLPLALKTSGLFNMAFNIGFDDLLSPNIDNLFDEPSFKNNLMIINASNDNDNNNNNLNDNNNIIDFNNYINFVDELIDNDNANNLKGVVNDDSNVLTNVVINEDVDGNNNNDGNTSESYIVTGDHTYSVMCNSNNKKDANYNINNIFNKNGYPNNSDIDNIDYNNNNDNFSNNNYGIFYNTTSANSFHNSCYVPPAMATTTTTAQATTTLTSIFNPITNNNNAQTNNFELIDMEFLESLLNESAKQLDSNNPTNPLINNFNFTDYISNHDNNNYKNMAISGRDIINAVDANIENMENDGNSSENNVYDDGEDGNGGVVEDNFETSRQKYLERRKKNNIASRRSRQIRKVKFSEMEAKAAILEKDNEMLKVKISKLETITRQMKESLVEKLKR